ncbi:LolA family protein [Agilicoccus flavus]|uniref:LolA family protein n=1 Tax=Agilicoccus flavus TaxID=2775968 RepID=UPI001CF60FFB|nr:sigma-E factor regulatory protein RseB domain-containing protein [Agilicoccus flavus]
MSFIEEHPHVRWVAPAAVLALVAGGATLTSAQADQGLAAKTAEQLLVDLQGSTEDSFSGTVATKVDLGLPALPDQGGGTTSFEGLASGAHTLRVWADGAQRQRVTLLGDGGEAAMVRDGRTMWLWNAQEQTATRAALPTEATPAQARARAAAHAKKARASASAGQLPSTPQEAARYVLDRIDPSTRVTTNGSATVAGRAAHELVLTPRAGDSLVRQVAIDVDAQTSMPLRVRVTSAATGSSAIDVGFTSLDLDAPAASIFAFTPPLGATVETAEREAGAETSSATPKAAAAKDTAAKPQVVGTGWSAVAVQRLPADAARALAPGAPGGAAGDDARANDAMSFLENLPVTSGDWGSGRVVEGTLFSAILTTDGRLAVGAVPADRLQAALTTTAKTSAAR